MMMTRDRQARVQEGSREICVDNIDSGACRWRAGRMRRERHPSDWTAGNRTGQHRQRGLYQSGARRLLQGALPASSQIELGTLRLEGTDNAVTAQQAKALLPLWQAIQSGSLQGNAETNAVLKQIEGTMTAGQLAAIAAMHLTFEDLGSVAQDQGVALGSWPQAQGTRQAGGSGQGGAGFPGNLSDEQRAAMRATAQAGGFNGAAPGGNMSADQRAALRATAEASGMTFGSSRAGGSQQGFLAVLAKPLIDLLTQRAAG
jgi:hypothetical protein